MRFVSLAGVQRNVSERDVACFLGGPVPSFFGGWGPEILVTLGNTFRLMFWKIRLRSHNCRDILRLNDFL